MEEIKIKALIDAGDSAKTVGELKKALRELKSAALQLDEGSAAFDNITKAAGELQDKIGDLNARTKNLGSDLKNLEGFMSIGTGIAGAFSAMQGAAALFGGENKQLEESLLRVQSAMGILQGIQAVANVLQKESSAMLLVNNALRKISAIFTKEQAVASTMDAVAKEAEAIATGEAAVAQEGLNVAMKSNPVLALVGLITAAVAALWAFTGGSKEAEEAQKGLNEEIKKMNQNALLEQKTFEASVKALKEMKTGSEERAIAIEKINKQYGTSLKNLTDEELFLKQVNEQVKDYTRLAKERLFMKINEAKAETFLQQASEKRFENEKKRADLSNVMMKYKSAMSAGDERSIAITKKVIDNLNEEIAANEKVALGYEAKANKVLNANAKMLSDETSQEREERLKRDKDAEAAAAKKKADEAKASADKLKAIKKSAEDERKATLLEEEKKQKAILEYSEANAKSIKAIEDYIQSVQDSTTKNYLDGWKSTYIERVAMIDANLKIETKKYMDDYQSLNNLIKETFEKSPAYITFKTKNASEMDPVKLAKSYNDALNAYIDVTPGLRAKLSQAQNVVNIAIQSATTKAAKDSAQVWKEEFEKVKDQVKETTRIALSTEEYERFYEFVKIKNSQLAKDMEGQFTQKRKTAKEETDLLKSQISILETEIKQRTELNVLKGKGASIENMKKQLDGTDAWNFGAAVIEPAERQAIKDTIEDLEKKNKVDKESIDIKNVQIKQKLKEIEEAEELIKKSRLAYNAPAPISEKKPTNFVTELENFTDILNTQLPGAKAQVEDFGTEIDIVSNKIAISLKDGQVEFGITMDEWETGMVSAQKTAKYLEKTITRDPKGLEKLVKQNGSIEASITKATKKNLAELFDLNREYNSKTLGDANKTNIQLAAIYKDKNNLIKAQEADINKNMGTLFQDAEKVATERGDQNILTLMKTLKKADGTFKEFAVTVTDEANQFGIEMFGTIFDGRLNTMNAALTKRYEAIAKAEETAYNDALFAQFKLFETGKITREEYNKNTETIDKNHKENMLAIEVSYGKKSQADMLAFYKGRTEEQIAEEEKEKARKIKNAETLLDIERTLQQALFDSYTQGIDKRSQEIERNLNQEIEAIDARQAAYEEAASDMTNAEKTERMIMDNFDKERKDAEDKAAAEQQGLDKKRFDADKANKAISVGLEYALAIAKAWGTLGPFGAPMALFLGAQALIAETAILSAEYIPAFAEGGFVSGPGGPTDDKINARLSNGESVINAKSTKMFAPILSAMNVAGGGKAFPMATGGMVTPTMMQEAAPYDMSRLEDILETWASRPIETYVKESSITSAQRDASKIQKRTRF